MQIKNISLSNFRIYGSEKSFSFSTDVTGIIGENARGKTTLLEAVYMMCRGKGFREREEYELLRFGESSGYLVGTFEDSPGVLHERAIMYRKAVVEGDEEKLEKKYYIDKAPSGQLRYSRSNPPVVLFAPQHIDIIVHGPTYRREYFNSVIASKNLEYSKALREYDAVLRRRNAVLENYESIGTLKQDLSHWNDLLLENANVIQKYREAYMDFLKEDSKCADKEFKIIYHKNRIDADRLSEIFEKESSSRRTLVGPQKDDFEIQIEVENNYSVSVHAYASRSQQRLAILWLKMRELEYKAKENGSPILLLDDVYSEFDTSYRQIITSIIPQYQTIVTATEEITIPPDVAHKMQTIRV